MCGVAREHEEPPVDPPPLADDASAPPRDGDGESEVGAVLVHRPPLQDRLLEAEDGLRVVDGDDVDAEGDVGHQQPIGVARAASKFHGAAGGGCRRRPTTRSTAPSTTRSTVEVAVERVVEGAVRGEPWGEVGRAMERAVGREFQ